MEDLAPLRKDTCKARKAQTHPVSHSIATKFIRDVCLNSQSNFLMNAGHRAWSTLVGELCLNSIRFHYRNWFINAQIRLIGVLTHQRRTP